MDPQEETRVIGQIIADIEKERFEKVFYDGAKRGFLKGLLLGITFSVLADLLLEIFT